MSLKSRRSLFLFCLFLLQVSVMGQSLSVESNPSGATERTPSYSQYFSWINNTNEGTTEIQTKINLDFFRYLRDTYGMQLDIYAFDAGAVDGSKRYGTMQSDEFKQKFPGGFGPISQYAAQTGTRLGLWGGPDGYGDTQKEAQQRHELMVSLVRDFNFGLFKMDGVCGDLRPEKYDWFVKTMAEVRKYAPDLILLNHRLNLGPGMKYATTSLLGGKETYIDAHMTNSMTASHHRAEALAREIPPTRLTEDHGVCLSSCLDYWDDDLILQAFNRNLILAPEIYGNPWFLKDEEYSQLAYIFNLHRDYRNILVDGKQLPEAQYGPGAMSRGDGKTMFLTLRNLGWEKVRYVIRLDDEVGLKKGGNVKVRMYHPYIQDMGSYRYGSTVEVEVLPFRSCLVKVTTGKEKDNVLVSGIPYQIINDRVGSEYQVRLLGKPGESYQYTIRTKHSSKTKKITFPGEKMREDPIRHISSMQRIPVPEDISSVYYATVFAADNNSMEDRSLERAGKSSIPQVQAARDAFFNQTLYIDKGITDRNLFDSDENTFFNITFRRGELRLNGTSAFLLDMGKAEELDQLIIKTDHTYSLSPLCDNEGTYAQVSADLVTWKTALMINGTTSVMDLSKMGPVRYIRFDNCPIRLSEVYGLKNGMKVSTDLWHASNLFDSYDHKLGKASRVWKSEFVLDEIADNAYLCVAVNGKTGVDGAWAGFKIDGEYVGCPDRAPSYVSNVWEKEVKRQDGNYTYYLPLTKDMLGKKIEAYVLSMDWAESLGDLQPEVYLSAYPLPFSSVTCTTR